MFSFVHKQRVIVNILHCMLKTIKRFTYITNTESLVKIFNNTKTVKSINISSQIVLVYFH